MLAGTYVVSFVNSKFVCVSRASKHTISCLKHVGSHNIHITQPEMGSVGLVRLGKIKVGHFNMF